MTTQAINNNNDRASSAIPIIGGAALGGAGGALGTKSVLGSKLKTTMESADSFSKSKKAPEVVSTLAEEAKGKLKATQDDFIAGLKEYYRICFREEAPEIGFNVKPKDFLEFHDDEAMKELREAPKADIDKLLKEAGFTDRKALEEAAAIVTPEQKLLSEIEESGKTILKQAGYDPSKIWEMNNVSRSAQSTIETQYPNAAAFREAVTEGNESAAGFLDKLVERFGRPEFGLDKNTVKEIISSDKFENVGKQMAEAAEEMLRGSNYEDLGALKSAAGEMTPAQELLEKVQVVEINKETLSVIEKARTAAEAIVGTADKPGLEATSEALENASKATDAAGIKSSIEGIWGSVKESAESAYKSLNKKTVRMAGILGAAGLGLAGYIIAKSKNSDK